MPTTRSQNSSDNLLSLSVVKVYKRKIQHDDSINVTKKQRRVPLRKRRAEVEMNVNNVSILSDHNDDHPDVTLVFSDENVVPAQNLNYPGVTLVTDDHPDVTLVFSDENVVPANTESPPSQNSNYPDVTLDTDDEHEVQAPEPLNISLEIEEVGGEMDLEFDEISDNEVEEQIEKQFQPGGRIKYM